MRSLDAVLVPCATLLAGCGYYHCRDTIVEDFLPQPEPALWLDETTLELEFEEALADPAEVDPRRFALVRDQVDLFSPYYNCEVELTYRELEDVSGIPESLSWDPESPTRLRLHFADPIPSSACEPWPGTWAEVQSLALFYLGPQDIEEVPDYTFYETELILLRYASGSFVDDIGPYVGLSWRERCIEQNACSFEEFSQTQGGYDDYGSDDVWVACP